MDSLTFDLPAHPARATAGQPSLHLRYLLPRTQRRNAWFGWGRGSGGGGGDSSKPLIDEMSKRERQQKLLQRMSDNTQGSSIFDEEIKDPARARGPGEGGGEGGEGGEDGGAVAARRRQQQAALSGPSRMKEHRARAEDPDPRWRIRYQKKKIMQVMRGPRIKPAHEQRADRIRLTEKQITHSSDLIPTSTKKLVHLAHQIVGKTVDDAIVQMRFSKKKMAREVRYQLEEARDHAIASRGMGLGEPEGRLLPEPRRIQTKDGRWLEIEDPTRLYVDESWVTKGPYRAPKIKYHARSRMSAQYRPTTRKQKPLQCTLFFVQSMNDPELTRGTQI